MAIIDNFTEEELRIIVQESKSYREVLKKLGYATYGGNNNATLKKRLEKYNISTEHFTTIGGIERNENNVFCQNSTASQATLRRWFVKGNYIPYQCSVCGISTWQGKELSLQLDHINGNNSDDRIENLRWLCPNCHSQTDTFCGKQSKKSHATKEGVQIKEQVTKHCISCGKPISKTATYCPECAAKARRVVIERPSAEELTQLLKDNNGNFSKIGKMYGVNDNSIRKWCKYYNLPFHSSDYKD